MAKAKIEEELLKANIFDLIGLKGLSEEKKLALAEKMAGVVSTRLGLRVARELSPDDKLAFDRLLAKSPSEEEVGKFLGEKVPNFAGILAEEVASFKEGLMKDVDRARELLKS